MSGGQKFILFCILVSGMLLRFWGLSHDLHENNIYHPDTPKQVRAAERFLNGQYYYHVGILDYDAYPYFNPHLVEYICRTAAVIQEAAFNVAGVPYEQKTPDMITLFWLTRILNAILSTGLILLIFQIGRENFGIRQGLLAALLAAFSPVDMIACHFAGAETTSCFFTALALLFAFRIYRDGLHRDYLLAGICTACAFASKYHAAMVIVPVLLAHWLRGNNLRSMFGGASIGRLMLLGTAGIAACFLAIPTLAGHFQESVVDIIHFFTQISSGRGMDADVRAAGKLAKFIYSMERNIPILITILGPLVCFAVLAELYDTIRRRNPLKLILFSLPCVYFLVGVSMRPMASPVYHTLMTPMLFLIAALFFSGWNPSQLAQRQWLRHLLGFMVAISAAYLFYVSARQAFFFWHQDTSRAALAWIKENTPPTFNVVPGGYTFSAEPRRNPTAPANGLILAESNLQQLDKPASALYFKTFSVEPLSLAIFIDTSIELYRDNAEGLGKSFLLPSFPRWPSQTGNQMVFDNGPEFVRSEKLIHLQPREEAVRWLVRSNKPDRVWIHCRNGSIPNNIELSFGHISKRMNLESGESAWYSFSEPTANFPTKGDHIFYRFAAEAAHGPASVLIATTPGEIGSSLFEAGLYKEAASFLAKAATETGNPSIAANAIICDAIANTNLAVAANPAIMANAKQLLSVTDSASMQSVFGISLNYLNSLDYICLNPADLFLDTATSNNVVTSRNMMLAPGYYSVSFDLNGSTAAASSSTVQIAVLNRSGGVLQQQNRPQDLPASGPVSMSFLVTAGATEVAICLKTPVGAPALTNSLAIKPDILRNIAAQSRMLKAIETLDPVACADEPLAYDALIALGDVLANRSMFADAYSFYMAAGKARPNLKTHLIRIAGIQTNLAGPELAAFSASIDRLKAGNTIVENTSEARFAGGIRFIGYRISNPSIKPGRSLGLNLYWQPKKITTRLHGYGVFVHILDAGGRIVFQADHPLINDLVLRRDNSVIEPFFNEYPVPQGLNNGTYQIRFGIFKPATGRKVDIETSSFETHRDEIIIPTDLLVTSGINP